MTEKRKITKKVISAKSIPDKEQIQQDVQISDVKAPSKKGCVFCQNKNEPTFTDTASLKRYVSDRGKIVPRARTFVCSKHQRQITRAIKYARHLALLPFTTKV